MAALQSLSGGQTVATVDVQTASDLVCCGSHRYLDVRTEEEFKRGHPENAANVPYIFFGPQGQAKNESFMDQVSEIFGKDDQIVVGCESGVRSFRAATDLMNAGYENVKNMGGGFAAWTGGGFAVKMPRSIPEQTETTPVAVTVDVHAALDLVRSNGHRYLDVRTVDEFNKGHPENALNIPYMFFTTQGRVKNEEFIDQVSEICSKDDPIVVGCASGVRSLRATEDLLNAGFKHPKNMGGGFAAWTDCGHHVVVQPRERI